MNNMVVEDMSHLADGFVPEGSGEHPSQKNSRPIKVKLLFFVTLAEDDPYRTDDTPCKLVSVRVPKGTPIYRLRMLIGHIERELRSIYHEAQRTQAILEADENSDRWSLSFNLPMYGVTYV